jgi:hypothetical protein
MPNVAHLHAVEVRRDLLHVNHPNIRHNAVLEAEI